MGGEGGEGEQRIWLLHIWLFQMRLACCWGLWVGAARPAWPALCQSNLCRQPLLNLQLIKLIIEKRRGDDDGDPRPLNVASPWWISIHIKRVMPQKDYNTLCWPKKHIIMLKQFFDNFIRFRFVQDKVRLRPKQRRDPKGFPSIATTRGVRKILNK